MNNAAHEWETLRSLSVVVYRGEEVHDPTVLLYRDVFEKGVKCKQCMFLVLHRLRRQGDSGTWIELRTVPDGTHLKDAPCMTFKTQRRCKY